MTLPTHALPWHQEPWTNTLAQIDSGTAPHAYMISAQAASGKRFFADMLAQRLLCHRPLPQSACGNCTACLLSAAGNNPDLIVVKPLEKSKVIRIEQIRDLKQFIEISSHSFGKRIIIIDTAETLNISSANALLKGLEEPPQDAVFLILSDRPKAVMATISSRCRSLKLGTPGASQATDWLAAQVPTASSEDIEFALDYAQGRVFKALTMLEEETKSLHENIGKDLLQVIRQQTRATQVATRYQKTNCAEVLNILIYWLSALSKFQVTGQRQHVKGQALLEAAQLLPREEVRNDQQARGLMTLYRNVVEAQTQVAGVSNPNLQLLLEDLLMQLQQLFRKSNVSETKGL